MNSREQMVLFHEGQVLQQAGHSGPEAASENARCVIDGCFNGILRIENRGEAAKYAYAIADRLATGFEAITPWPPLRPELAALNGPQPASPTPLPEPAPAKARFWRIYLLGWACGFIVGAAIGMARR